MKCPKCNHEWTPGKVAPDEWDAERERRRQIELRATYLVENGWPYLLAVEKAKAEIGHGGPQLA